MILTGKLCMAFYMGKFFENPISQDLKLNILVLKTSRFWKEIMLRTKLFFTLKEPKKSKTFRSSFCFRWKTDFKNFWWIRVCCVKRWLESVSQLTYYCLYKIIPKLFREHQIFINLHENIFLYKYTYNMHLYHTDPILYFTNANMTVFKVWSFENKTLKSPWPRENLFF